MGIMICKHDECYMCKWRYEQGEHCESCCRNYDDNFEEEEKDGEQILDESVDGEGKDGNVKEAEAKKCPICGSDLYEHCYMCCYEGKRVKRNE